MNDQRKIAIDKILKNVVETENIINPKVKYITNTTKNGYVGEIVKMEITGSNKNLYLVGKCSNTQGDFFENMNIHDLFIREIEIYEEIMPLFKSLQEKYNAVLPFDKLPKCYGCNRSAKNEVLVLEDLIKSGFKLCNSRETLEEQHLELVLKEYAKLHAVSLAFKHHDYEDYKAFLDSKVSIMDEFQEAKGLKIIKNCIENVKACFEDNEDMGKAYCKFCERFEEFYKLFSKRDEYSIIYHGDSWCNNFLFKFEDKKVIDVRFLDFQLASPGPLAYDLSYFIMANSPRIDQDSVNRYLNLYYNNLVERLEEMGCPAEKSFPREIFMEQWKKYSATGLIMAITALKFATAGDDEKPDIAKDFTDAVNFVGENYNEYKRRVREIVNYYYTAGFI